MISARRLDRPFPRSFSQIPLPILLPAILVGAVCLAYLNSFWGEFQFDDYNVIVTSPPVHSWAGWLEDLPHGIRPLLKASYTLNWTSGLGLFGFHLFNLVAHLINVLLVYVLSRRCLDGAVAVRSDQVPATALPTALLFALHPVQTEAVTYISGRSTSLMALLYLGSLLAYLSGIERKSPARLYGLSPFLFLGSLATKEVAVTLPAALLLWELTCRPERPSWGTIAKRQALHGGLLLAALVVLFVHPRYEWLLAFSVNLRPLRENLLTQIHGVAYLLSQLVLVQRLNIDPDLPILTRWTAGLAAESVGLASLLALGLASFRRRPWLAFGILWLFLHLLPTNSLLPRLDVANDRQLYLPRWGVFLSFSVMLALLREKNFQRVGARGEERVSACSGRVGAIVAVILVLLLAGVTVARNDVYRSEVALWEDTVAKSLHKARAYNNLGYAYFLAGRPAESREAYLTALRPDPAFELARNNLTAVASDDPRSGPVQAGSQPPADSGPPAN